MTTCCESMDELQTAAEGGQSDPATGQALGSLSARLRQVEQALFSVAAQQTGNCSEIAALSAHGADLASGLEGCERQLASFREEVNNIAAIYDSTLS